MSTFPGLPQPKKKRNPRLLQLSAEALAPRPLDYTDDDDCLNITPRAQSTYIGSASSSYEETTDLTVSPSAYDRSSSISLSVENLTLGKPVTSQSTITLPSSSSSSTSSSLLPCSSTSDPALSMPIGLSGLKKSSISRKKPVGLDISKSIGPTRLAPTPSTTTGSSAGRIKKSSSSSSPSSGKVSYQQKLASQLESLHLGGGNGKTKTDLKGEDLKVVGDLGSGNGGTVAKVLHEATGLYMARKLVLIDAKPSVRKQILRELQIMHDCSSPYIVSFYGAFMADPHICICMEHMDRGSLDNIYRKHGSIDIDIVGKIAHAVLEGLTYLYDVHRIIHRDVKPSNILVNSEGEIKLCDFGVSGELINSIANTFVGTSTYMSPERIQGAPYTVKSDVWSLGISLIEMALGRFPFSDSDDADDSDIPSSTSSATITSPPTSEKRKSKGVSLGGGGMTMSILDLLQHIVNEPAPKLGEPWGVGTVEGDFVDRCLEKDPTIRPNPAELSKLTWMIEIENKNIDLKAWAKSLGFDSQSQAPRKMVSVI
ncbi:pkinase-domain-containing protein [Phaffia rhodozyma]|uniref:Pkinase-domain-containing protein n=1 Tax=Phaffia rhodozyma TaxID=264483 RepID=A0A0F7SHS0_PHARH|nr:pkinase-domain-containing protein [Phaffia rhodozyma]